MVSPGIIAAVAGAAGSLVLAPFLISAAGFTSGGIAAGSVASSMMSSAAVANGGGVAAGGLVATLQSLGAAGLTKAATVAVASAGAAVGGATEWLVRTLRR
ncbi:uncharacterized protein Hap1MRO34_009738 [Clarias gariepinus]|uniref:interferon alpha-inducible protein 27-like protein 2A n=1 Tax=Clarias gariepinus TaxID=13013 RepID=UPI00234E071B|nr:interferon alpha-inducible protein 27-like protein 2A [Clarias gariepinus]